MGEYNLEYRLRLVGNAQTGSRRIVGQETRNAAGLIIDDVALDIANSEYDRIRLAFQGSIRRIIMEEMQRLASAMLRGWVGVAAKSTGPRGTLDVKYRDVESPLAKAVAGGSPRMSLSQFGIRWAPRSRRYLRRKVRSGRGDSWFVYDGELGSNFAGPSELMDAFGPVSVTFRRADQSDRRGVYSFRDDRGRFARAPDTSGYVATRSSSSGAPLLGNARQRKLGTLEVEVFGEIRDTDLPALATGNPLDIEPESGMIGLLPDDVQVKLRGTAYKPFRYTFEPFISWFLTRAVPYVVARRVAEVLSLRGGENRSRGLASEQRLRRTEGRPSGLR